MHHRHTHPGAGFALALSFLLAFLTVAASGCGDDAGTDDTSPTGGTAGQNGGTAGMPTMGQAGTAPTAGAGQGGAGGTGMDSGMPTTGVAGAGGAGGTGGVGGDDDAGAEDAGNPPARTVCGAPVMNTSPGNTCPGEPPVPLEVALLNDMLDVPVFVTQAPGDDARLFVAERRGRVVMLDAQSGDLIDTFLDIEARVTTSSSLNAETGFLGLAFHPDYPEDKRVFVNYTTSSSGIGAAVTRVSAFTVAADGNSADMASEQVLLDYDQPQGNHNGGMIAFGPDGCLFIGSGDGGNFNDVGQGHAAGGNGQSLDTLLGKMLRIDVDNPDSTAPGNLPGGEPQIWDYGLRNPWRFSFDRATGDLYIGDVGQGAWEEIDVEPAGSGQKNYGWPVTEGNHCLSGNCSLGDYEPAVDEYPHQSGNDCVVGGYVYRGSAIPSLQGYYVYGDNGPGSGGRRLISAFVWDGAERCGGETIELSARDDITLAGEISSFGEDNAGELYITTTAGQLYKLQAQ